MDGWMDGEGLITTQGKFHSAKSSFLETIGTLAEAGVIFQDLLGMVTHTDSVRGSLSRGFIRALLMYKNFNISLSHGAELSLF